MNEHTSYKFLLLMITESPARSNACTALSFLGAVEVGRGCKRKYGDECYAVYAYIRVIAEAVASLL